ncbi:MAG TPA: hypothetical protein VNO70_06995 [Blastocatellia bacterium]|nr:hypothetical protein [Blastocatellia bacterium]
MFHALPFILLLSLPASFPGGAKTSLLQKATPQKPVQHQPAPSTDESAILKPESLSPYVIEWFIDMNEGADLKQIWRLLKIEIPGDMPYRCGGDCTAETFDIPIKGEEQGQTVALKISFAAGDYYQYLFFKRVNSDSTQGRWKFIGNIDAHGQRYGSPEHRIESGNNRTWFVIRELQGRGSGMIAYGEAWHEITERGLKQVLSYPAAGHYIPCQNLLGRSYKSFLVRQEMMSGAYSIQIQFLVSYNISACGKGSDSPPLFAKGHKVFYVWDDQRQRFILDASQSDISEKELNEIYSMQGLSNEKFMEDNFNELLTIAGDGSAEQRNWLRQFLTGLADSPRKMTLRQALQQ